MKKIIELIQYPFRSRMARNAAYLSAGQGVNFFLLAVNFLILARLLGPADYGLFSGVFALTNLIGRYTPVGSGMVLLRYVSGDRNSFVIFWGNLLLATIGFGCVMTIVLLIFGTHILNSASAPLIPFAAIANCVFMQITTESSRVYQAFEQMWLTAIMNLLTNLMRVIIAIGLWITLHHATALQWAVASMLISGLAAAFAIGNITMRYGLPKFSFRIFLKHSLEGLGYSVSYSAASIYNDIDKTMLSHYGMNVANGIYTSAYRGIDIATVLISSIRDAAMPRMFQVGRHGLSQAAHFSFTLLRRAILIATVLAVCIFFCAPILPRLIGKGFAESQEVLRWLCLIPVFRAVHQIVGSALTGAGLQRYRTASQFLAAAFNFALNLWLIPAFSWRGAAWASLATDGALALTSVGLVAVLSRRERKYALKLTN